MSREEIAAGEAAKSKVTKHQRAGFSPAKSRRVETLAEI
jgi:hypothetical protein